MDQDAAESQVEKTRPVRWTETASRWGRKRAQLALALAANDRRCLRVWWSGVGRCRCRGRENSPGDGSQTSSLNSHSHTHTPSFKHGPLLPVMGMAGSKLRALTEGPGGKGSAPTCSPSRASQSQERAVAVRTNLGRTCQRRRRTERLALLPGPSAKPRLKHYRDY